MIRNTDMFKIINSFTRVLEHPLNKDKPLNTLGRILWWKYNQHFIKLPATVEIVEGVRCMCYPDSSYGGLIVYQRFPEYEEMNYIHNKLKKGDVFIDIGANIGAISLIAASKVGDHGKVYAFEPNKVVLPRLVENVHLNNMDGIIKVLAMAVSNTNSEVTFINEEASEVSHISYSKRSEMTTELVKTVALNKFIKNNKINKVKMIKIDVEGAELNVLKGCMGVFNNIESMLVEINTNSEKYGNSTQDTLDFISEQGYKTYHFADNGELVKIRDFPANKRVINVLAIKKTIQKT